MQPTYNVITSRSASVTALGAGSSHTPAKPVQPTSNVIASRSSSVTSAGLNLTPSRPTPPPMQPTPTVIAASLAPVTGVDGLGLPIGVPSGGSKVSQLASRFSSPANTDSQFLKPKPR